MTSAPNAALGALNALVSISARFARKMLFLAKKTQRPFAVAKKVISVGALKHLLWIHSHCAKFAINLVQHVTTKVESARAAHLDMNLVRQNACNVPSMNL